jgi:PAS domain S-box-containing protein
MMGRTGFDENWRFLDELNTALPLKDYPVNKIMRSKKPLLDYRVGVYRPVSNDVVWVVLNGYPVLNSDDEVIEVVISFIDVTQRKNAEDALLESEHYLQNSQEIAQLGVYTVDLKAKRWTSSLLLDAIVGINVEYDKTIENWGALVHSDWKDAVAANFNSVLAGANRISDIIYKIIRPIDKQERWVRSRGEVEVDKNGVPVKVIGTIQDITDLKNAEEALKISEQKYRSIFENLQDIFFQIDMAGQIIEISPSVNYYSELQRDELLGKPVLDFYSVESDRGLLLNELAKYGEIRDYELDLKSKTGHRKHTSVNARLVYKNNEPVYVEGFIRDVTRRKTVEKALKESETFLRETQFIAKLGTFNFDTVNNT